MLSVIQKGYNGVQMTPVEEIVYCVSSMQRMVDSKLEFIYTDGHATNGFTDFFSINDISSIQDQIDMDATNAKYWNKDGDLDFKRRKEAELLIKGDLPIEYNLGFLVYSDRAKELMIQKGMEDKLVIVKPNYYF